MMLVLEFCWGKVRHRFDRLSFSEPAQPFSVLDCAQMTSTVGQGVDMTVASEAALELSLNFDFIPFPSKHEPDLLYLCV